MRAYAIAFMARRYRLLSERPEYLSGTHGERIESLLRAEDVGELDKTLILHTSAIDQLCGHLVTLLRTAQRVPLSLLGAFGVMDPDRIVAVYYALPANRRDAVLCDPVWSHHIRHASSDIEQAIREIDQLAAETQNAVVKLAELAQGAPAAERRRTLRHERATMSLASRFPDG